MLRLVVHILCWVPISIILWRLLTDNAGANPIEFITRETGTWTLHFLLITLTIRPATRLFKRAKLLLYRRAVGLYAFFYGSCHFTTYLWLDQFFDWREIILDIAERPFILAGFSAFILLIPLAATSNRWAIIKLGAFWQTLHRLVYFSISIGLLHYWWLIRADYQRAWIYLIILSSLFAYRIVHALSRRNAEISR